MSEKDGLIKHFLVANLPPILGSITLVLTVLICTAQVNRTIGLTMNQVKIGLYEQQAQFMHLHDQTIGIQRQLDRVDETQLRIIDEIKKNRNVLDTLRGRVKKNTAIILKKEAFSEPKP